MMKTTFTPLLLLLLFFLPHHGEARTIMGADIAWECLGNDKYKITARVYRDCNGNNMSNTRIRFIGNCSGLTTSSQTMHPGRDITPVCKGQLTRCNSSGTAFQYGVEEYKLVTTLDVKQFKKNGCCNVTISWSSCCRNTGINTGAANQNFYTEGRMNVCQTPCDNSPVFNSQPVSIFCLGRDVIINAGATDKDRPNGIKDSLVYSFTDPRTSAARKATWKSPFSSQKPISYLGFPKDYDISRFPFGFHLDSTNGEFMFRPMKLEQTLFAVKVEEYRNGKKMGEVRRDAQIIVIKCPSNQPPVINGVNCAVPKPQNFKTYVCAGTQVCFNICTSDYNKDDTVTIDWDKGIPGASFTVANQGKLKREVGRFCWTPPNSGSSSSNKPYQFVVTAKDNSCPVNGISQRVFTIYVSDSANSGVTFSKKAIKKECRVYQLTARTPNRSQYDHWIWFAHDSIAIGYTRGADSSQIQYTFKDNGRIPIKIVADRGACSHIFHDTIEITGTNPIKHNRLMDTSICLDKNYMAPVVASGGNKPLHISWEHDDSLYVSDTIAIDFSSNVKSGRINYFIEDSLGCKEEHTFQVLNKTVKTDAIENDHTICQDTIDKKITLKASTNINHQQVSGQWTGKGITDSTFDGKGLPSGRYSLFYYGEAYGYCLADTIDVYIRDNPKVSAGVDRRFCLSTSPIKLMGTPSGGTWKASGTKVIKDVFYPQASDSTRNTVFYKYVDQHGCSAMDKAIFTRLSHKPFVNAGNDITICDNDSIVLNQGLPTNGIWTGPIITNRFGDSNFVVTPQKVNKNTNYLARYEIQDKNGCKNSDSVQITVRPSTYVTVPKRINHCFSGNLIDTAFLVAKPSGGQWIGNGTFLSDTSLKIGQNSLGDHSFTYQYQGPNGCIDSDSTTLTVRSKPLVHVPSDTFCVRRRYPYRFNATPNGGVWSGSWIAEQNGVYTSIVGGDRIGIFTYHYRYTDKYGCVSNKRMQLSVGTRTTSDFIPSSTEGEAPLVVDFQNRSENGKNFQWDFGNGDQSTEFGPRATYLDSGTYTVSLIVTDSDGFCKAESSKNIIVSGSSDITKAESLPLVSVYPSPASDQVKVLNLSHQRLQLSIISANGQILSERITNGNSIIDVSSMSPGVYLLKVTDQKSQIQFSKVVIE